MAIAQTADTFLTGLCDTGRTPAGAKAQSAVASGASKTATSVNMNRRETVMTQDQIRDRIRELEDKLAGITGKFWGVALRQRDTPRENGDEATSVKAGEIGEDLTRDR